MFTSNEIRQLTAPYFHLIRETDEFMEVKSKNTGHCWIVKKIPGYVMLYHKHRQKDPYYHKHRKVFTVALAVSEIKSHDDYEIRNSRIS